MNQTLVKLLVSLIFNLLSSPMVVKFFLNLAEKMAKSTEFTEVDDNLVIYLKKLLLKPNNS